MRREILDGPHELALHCKIGHRPLPGKRGLDADAIKFHEDGWSLNDVDHSPGDRATQRRLTLELMRRCRTVKSKECIAFFDSESVRSCSSCNGLQVVEVFKDPLADCERGPNPAHCLVVPIPSDVPLDLDLFKQEVAMLLGDCPLVSEIEASA